MRTHLRTRCATLAALAMVLTASCSGSPDTDPQDGGAPDPSAAVTITVGNMPPEAQAAQRAEFMRTIEAFQEANPNITVTPEETTYKPATFNAMLAGGTMPTVLEVPFTEVQRIVEQKQVADITDHVADSEVISELNPVLRKQGVDAEGRTWAIPWNMYTIGLVYNRAVFEQAGLDPDSPPTTWDEVVETARTITEKTGVPGFVMPTAGRNGGWMLTALNYSFGGTIQDFDGTRATMTLDTEAMTKSLDLLRRIRWEADAAGSNFLLEGPDVRNEFAAGRVGMFLGAGDAYNQTVDERGFNGDDFGIAPLPQAPGGLGTLGGGAIAVISPKATPNEIAAGIKWVEFNRLSPYISQERAVAAARARTEDGLSVGAPTVPPVDEQRHAKYLEWVAEYITVDRERFKDYLASFETLPVVAEPARGAGDVYVELDTIVQGVFTDRDFDAPAALEQAATNLDALLASQE
ncbi:ABC transporter substrate-binding protein [Arachnia propionica]|nr:extracellular solute-binding protein [Arachnia propionica]